jgi:hypothetical protein
MFLSFSSARLTLILGSFFTVVCSDMFVIRFNPGQAHSNPALSPGFQNLG